MSRLDKGDTRLIIEKCKRHALLRNQAAYVLGTTYWETAQTMEPVRETLAKADADVGPRLERAWKRGQLPWVRTPYWRDGFWGRGYVQLTHERNYRFAGEKLGVDLVDQPFKALDAEIASEVLVRGMKEGWFTGKKLSDYITLQKSNYRGARRIVNGTDKATVIAELAREYEHDLLAEGYGVEPQVPVVNERRDGTPPREKLTESTTVQAATGLSLSGAGGVITAVTQMDSTAQYIILGFAGFAALCVLWIVRERIKKWEWGVR